MSAKPASPAVQFKFCGITRTVDASFAADLGASHVGVILAESSRKIDQARAREVFAAAGSGLKHVVVIGREPIDVIASKAAGAGADVVQLHGGATREEVEQLRCKFDGEIWAVVGVESTASKMPEEAVELAEVLDAILLDTSVNGKTGGTGTYFDWSRLAGAVDMLAKRTRIVVAGGLNPENVGNAINILHPSVVDVSSGVEAAVGVKDPQKMKAFAEAVVSASIDGRRSTQLPLSETE
ncbi:MAG TPA: phosphoribosylanthranilate isomerase [Gemmatimonadaceae bacterium]|nr:phosphoribosylanthranilate isomerase [Gemmatimonadaceae bacterium]